MTNADVVSPTSVDSPFTHPLKCMEYKNAFLFSRHQDMSICMHAITCLKMHVFTVCYLYNVKERNNKFECKCIKKGKHETCHLAYWSNRLFLSQLSTKE